MKALLCLLSDQHVPNTLCVHHIRPERLVLVESEAMGRREVGQHLLDALRFGGLDYGDRCDIEPLASEDDLEAIRAALRRAYGRYPSAEWTVNLTGGTKPMSIAAYEFFRALNGRLLYMNVKRPAVIADIEGGTEEACAHRLTIREFLAGYGFGLRKSPDSICEEEERARSWWPCAVTIAEHGAQEPLLNLADDAQRARARKKGLVLAPGQLQPRSTEIRAALQETFGLSYDGGSVLGALDEYQVRFLTGGWLEVFFWNVLQRNASALGLWDVRLGLDVGRLGAASGNDFDVSFMHEYGLCMVECKSGAQEHDPRLDILYKVEAVVRQFRALRVRAWLATTSDLIRDRSTGKVKDAIENRAAIYNCHLVLHETIRDLARCPDDADSVRSALFPTAGARVV
ncbi:MAG: DUF1887 family protein [Polyangiaceae bacterium]|nr:DUF1887 family protein [Polyangiaceae bacterium]